MPSLFQQLDMEQAATIFHVGTALPETVDFFAQYRCKLYFVDLFSALSADAESGEESGAEEPDISVTQFQPLLQFPDDTRFDICLFWDLFNFLDRQVLRAFLTAMRPHLKATTVAHAFSVHNRKTVQQSYLYGIRDKDTLSVRRRPNSPAGYSPHSQRELTELLQGFKVERSVLLPDSRLELLLHRTG
jgi:hypothetical protein